jgi:octaprenyl-diphosphate synthase
LLFAMRNGNAQQRETIRHAIEHGGLEELPTVIQAVKQTGALDHVRKLARQEADIGCAAIAHMPTSDYHTALINLANFAVDRSF